MSVGKVRFTPGIERTRSPKSRDRKDSFSRDVSQILLSLRTLPGSSLGWTFSLPLIVCLLGERMIFASTACISLKNKQTPFRAGAKVNGWVGNRAALLEAPTLDDRDRCFPGIRATGVETGDARQIDSEELGR